MSLQIPFLLQYNYVNSTNLQAGRWWDCFIHTLDEDPKSVWKFDLEVLISDTTIFKHPDRDIVHRKSQAANFKARLYHAWHWAFPIRGSSVACLKCLEQRDEKAGLRLQKRSQVLHEKYWRALHASVVIRSRLESGSQCPSLEPWPDPTLSTQGREKSNTQVVFHKCSHFPCFSSSQHNKWDNKWCQDIWILCPIPLYMWSCLLAESSTLLWRQRFQFSCLGNESGPGAGLGKGEAITSTHAAQVHICKDELWRRWRQWWCLAWRPCLQGSCDLSDELDTNQLNAESVI